MNNFSITDPQSDKRLVNALNKSFDSIQTLCDEYKPETTSQNFSVLNYQGSIREGNAIHLNVKAYRDTPIFCFYGSTWKYVGMLVGNTLTFTETLETTNEDGIKEDLKVLIYIPFQTFESYNRPAITKDRFYETNRVQEV